MVQVTGAHKDPLAGSAACPIAIDDDTSPPLPDLEDWSSDFLTMSSPRTVPALGEGSHADTESQDLVCVATDLVVFMTSNASHTPTHSPPSTPPSESKKRGRDEAVGK